MSDPFVIQSSDKDFKDKKIPNFSHNLDEGDYLPESQPETAALATPIKRGRIYFLFLFISLLTMLMLGRLFLLQIVHGQEYKDIADGNRVRILPIKANRGLIYDRKFQPLIKNRPAFSLIVVPGDLPKDKQGKEEILEQIFSILSVNEEIQEKIKEIFQNLLPNSYQEVKLLKDLDYQTAIKLETKLKNLSGINLKIEAKREYLNGQTLAHILGYVGKLSPEELIENPDYLITDFIGKTGLEAYYEDLLKGKDGQKRIEVNSLGKEERIISQQESQTGQDLILSLDIKLQEKVSQILQKHLKASGSKAGTIIVINPKNGEILSIFSWPTYDNNLFIKGKPEDYLTDTNEPLFFRAIAGEYPCGSVIKPVIAAAGLMDKIINKNTIFLSKGGFWVKQWFFADWKENGHGWTNLIKALAESVNTFFYYVGGGHGEIEGLGIERINYYAQLFGLSQKTGIDIPGESKGFLATPEWKEKIKKEPWYIGDTYHISIGQGDILVTPIQVANYTAAIANKGILFQPHLIKEYNNPETGDKKQILPKIIRKDFIDSEHLDLIKQGLRAAVTDGSARRLNSLPIMVAGKTGTAQVGGNKKSHAWFTGFAPYENPEIVVTVLIENGGGGDTVAVPVASEVFQFYFLNY